MLVSRGGRFMLKGWQQQGRGYIRRVLESVLFSRVGRFLRSLLWLRGTAQSVSERRNEYIAQLEYAAAAEEARNKELEERLEFKKREHTVLERIQGARSRKRKLGELLGEYSVQKRFSWKLPVILGGAFILLLLLFSQC